MMWLDVGIVFLLIIAIGFCYRLSDRLRSLKGLTGALSPSIERLSQVLNGASHSISFLKQATETSRKSLDTYIPSAQALSDDLLLLIEHADRISYRLDDLLVKASSIEKDLRQTVLVSLRQSEKKNIASEGTDARVQSRPVGDPRDLFVQRVISRYPKDPVEVNPMQLQSQEQK